MSNISSLSSDNLYLPGRDRERTSLPITASPSSSSKPIYALAFDSLLSLVQVIHDLVFRCSSSFIVRNEENGSRAICKRLAEKYSNSEALKRGILNDQTLIQDLTLLEESVRKSLFQRFFNATKRHHELGTQTWETISTKDFVTTYLRVNSENYKCFLSALQV